MNRSEWGRPSKKTSESRYENLEENTRPSESSRSVYKETDIEVVDEDEKIYLIQWSLIKDESPETFLYLQLLYLQYSIQKTT